ncbi:MAG TPA: DUF4292 domain-containing protein [Bacteroidales bacterium]|nr:DUF4292 domain-containing protein [Bacteroidales bacterium]HPI68556.1 DUF4292 domain-containing protein [Bacteroidales bacterium]HPR72503.1 DUF4292 domain-containing protein [Bacteroidales bacterium]HRW85788.1 DUF4292 domain-containing protein [Bacteroidales bacterium]
MRKISFIILIIYLMYGCSPARRTGITASLPEDIKEVYAERIAENNLTNKDFNISRADIEISTAKGKSTLLASLRYKTNGNYLLSIRSRTGIEIMRLYCSEDTIMINDRINRKLYKGSTEYLQAKYGISFGLIPLMLGDIVFDLSERNKIMSCTGEGKKNEYSISENTVEYIAECLKGKLKKARVKSSAGAGSIIIDYSRYISDDKNIYPSLISLKDEDQKTVLNMEIRRISFDTGEPIRFIKGAGYEEVILR